jgi:hypothetical protein
MKTLHRRRPGRTLHRMCCYLGIPGCMSGLVILTLAFGLALPVAAQDPVQNLVLGGSVEVRGVYDHQGNLPVRPWQPRLMPIPTGQSCCTAASGNCSWGQTALSWPMRTASTEGDPELVLSRLTFPWGLAIPGGWIWAGRKCRWVWEPCSSRWIPWLVRRAQHPGWAGPGAEPLGQSRHQGCAGPGRTLGWQPGVAGRRC